MNGGKKASFGPAALYNRGVLLKSLDILIGFSVVMLIASMAVTVLTQIWTIIANTRGTHLRDGLTDLLQHLHCAITRKDAKALAHDILTHPLIRDRERRLGSFLHRDELVRLLLEKASHPSQLRDALAQLGIRDPADTLRKIGETALAIAEECPALNQRARQELAILKSASSEFVAKIHGWFDQTIDRVSARFTITTRCITLMNAIFVAVLIQMDAVSLVNRLATDDALRVSLVEKAYSQEKLSAMGPNQLTMIASNEIFPAAKNPRKWRLAALPGITLSVLLLSLGAPFWFEALKNLLHLRDQIQVAPAHGRSGSA